MAQFILIGHDVDDSLERRKGARPAHLAHWGRLDAAGRVIYGGPLLDAAGEKPIGSVLVFEADSLAEAEALAQADPYIAAGVFAATEVRPVKQVFPGPAGV